VVKQVRDERTVASVAVTAAAEGAATDGAGAGISSSTAATHSSVELETGSLSLCQGDQDYWGKHIDKLINTYVQLIPDKKHRHNWRTVSRTARSRPTSVEIRWASSSTTTTSSSPGSPRPVQTSGSLRSGTPYITALSVLS